jgi:hypothetical protein
LRRIFSEIFSLPQHKKSLYFKVLKRIDMPLVI